MIEGVEFSGRGDRVSEFELKLLAQTKSESPLLAVVYRLAQLHGPRLAADAIGIVLDELGGEKVFIPHRRSFFTGLWQKDRDAIIVDLASRPEQDWSNADIGRALGVSREYVRKVLARQPDGTTKAARP